jgi:hypothetical protein
MTFGSHGTTTKNKAREKAGHAQNLLPIRETSGQVLFRSKDPTRADMVQLPVVHAQNILPDMARERRHFLWAQYTMADPKKTYTFGTLNKEMCFNTSNQVESKM